MVLEEVAFPRSCRGNEDVFILAVACDRSRTCAISASNTGMKVAETTLGWRRQWIRFRTLPWCLWVLLMLRCLVYGIVNLFITTQWPVKELIIVHTGASHGVLRLFLGC